MNYFAIFESWIVIIGINIFLIVFFYHMKNVLLVYLCKLIYCVGVGKRPFAVRLFSTQLVNEAGKFRLSIGRLSGTTNKQQAFSNLSHQSRAKKSLM